MVGVHLCWDSTEIHKLRLLWYKDKFLLIRRNTKYRQFNNMYTIQFLHGEFFILSKATLLQLIPTRWHCCSQFISLRSALSKPGSPHGWGRRVWWRPLPLRSMGRRSQHSKRWAVEGWWARVRGGGRETEEGGVGGQRWQAVGGGGELRGKWRERRRGGICGERRCKPGGGWRGHVVVARCGAKVRLEWWERRKQRLCRLLFPLRCANGIHRS